MAVLLSMGVTTLGTNVRAGQVTTPSDEQPPTVVIEAPESEQLIDTLSRELGRTPTRTELMGSVSKKYPGGTVLVAFRTDAVIDDSVELSYQTSNQCNGDVCHTVSGWKEYVSAWSAVAYQRYGDPQVCNPTARYWENGSILDVRHFNTGCRTVPVNETYGYHSALPWMPAFFENFDVLCNTYTPGNPLNGQPCSLITS